MSYQASTSFGDSLYTDPSLDQDQSFNISVDQSHSVDVALDETAQSESAAVGAGQVPMVRGVPQRRTFDSGYGDSQSCVSSPVAEPKKRLLDSSQLSSTGCDFVSQVSRDSCASDSRSRARLRRQKAVDRNSCPSSANSRHSRPNTATTKHQVANSSTDYEEYEDDDEYRSSDIRSINSASLGRLPMRGDSGCHVKAYNRLRRKTSFNANTSSSDGDEVNDEDDDEDEGNTSSTGHSSCSSSENVDSSNAANNSHHQLQMNKVARKLNRLAIPPNHLVTSSNNAHQHNSDLSPQIVSS